ncbi:MAG: MFS transporter, partial [Bryobacteraceae bacterium]
AWLRWVAYGVFVSSSTLNYLDRQLLATLAPLLMTQLHFNQTGFGFLISAFSIAYAASSLLTGWFLDRVGVNRGMAAAVSWWSASAIATGLVGSFSGLIGCRIALGVGESPAVPAAGKVNGMYLKPEERALGAAVNGIGISLGLALAPLWIGIALSHGWRAPFMLTGLLGFVWIPVWLVVSRLIQPGSEPQSTSPARPGHTEFSILRERNLILLVVANILWMGSYSLWSNWTTLYLVQVHHLTLKESAAYVWIPPLVSNAGGFFGGWLSLRWIRRKILPIAARQRAIWVSAIGSLLTLLLPLAPDARWATACISISFFFALSGSVNLYALPIDIYGAARSGLAIAALTCAYGVLQTVISPVIGYLADHRLYTEVVWIASLPLIAGACVLMGLRDTISEPEGKPA